MQRRFEQKASSDYPALPCNVERQREEPRLVYYAHCYVVLSKVFSTRSYHEFIGLSLPPHLLLRTRFYRENTDLRTHVAALKYWPSQDAKFKRIYN